VFQVGDGIFWKQIAQRLRRDRRVSARRKSRRTAPLE